MTFSMRRTQLALRSIVAVGLVLGLRMSPGTAMAAERAALGGSGAACDELLTVTLAPQQATDAALSDCTCLPKGCVRTQGYWGNKPGVSWPAGYDRNTTFYGSQLTWQQVLDSPTRGDAYVILAHQYIAAVLNGAAGASAPNSLRALLLAAGKWLQTAPPGTCTRGACPLQRSWAGVLDEYNNGEYPGAPRHCDED